MSATNPGGTVKATDPISDESSPFADPEISSSLRYLSHAGSEGAGYDAGQSPATPSTEEGVNRDPLVPPDPARFSTAVPPSIQGSTQNSYVASTPGTPISRPFLLRGQSSEAPARALLGTDGKDAGGRTEEFGDATQGRMRTTRKRMWWLLGITIVLIVVVLAIILPIVFVVIKRHHGGSSGSSGSSSGPASNPESPTGDITGGDGSTIKMADGSTFVYKNPFGGFCKFHFTLLYEFLLTLFGLGIDDPRDPYNSGARAQSFVPALNETWDFTRDQIRGVNLGGWLVLEPFIVPALYEKYQNVTPNPAIPGGKAVDEWTLSVAMTNDTSEGGGLNQLEDHYRTFITEQDFAQIAGAGLNWVRYVFVFELVSIR